MPLRTRRGRTTGASRPALLVGHNLGHEERLPGHYRLDAVCGHLLDRIGDTEAAAAHYRAAAARTTSEPERQYLVTKAAKLNQQHR
jgi:predicted RNA polymerase sigma factor